MKLPPIPASVFSIHGPITVEIVEDLRDPEPPHEKLFGLFDGFARVIKLRAGMHHTALWLTLEHERAHADIAEIGIQVSTDQEEAIVNAIAAARVAEMLATPPARRAGRP